jgi:hypothetical protein
MKKIISVILMVLLIAVNILPVYAAVPAESGGAEVTAGTDSLDGVMKGAEDFLARGSKTPVDEDELKKTSDFLYNVLLGIALVAAVIVGMIIGMRFMVASVDEKAKIKEQLVPYVLGCVVVFGAFGIWKLAVTILSSW